MKKLLVAAMALGMVACSSAPQEDSKMSESEAVKSISKKLDDAKEEVKDISEDIDKNLNEAIEKIEDETK